MENKKRMRVIIKKLIIKEPFWGALLMQCQIVETDNIWVAGMTIHNNQLFIFIHPVNYWDPKLTDIDRRNILKHEVLHAAFLHPLRLKLLPKELGNVCADYEVNSYIEELKNVHKDYKCCFPGDKKFPAKKTAEWYYAKSPKPKGGGGQGQSGMPQSGQGPAGTGQPQPGKGKSKPSNTPTPTPSGPMPKNATAKQRAQNAHKDWGAFRPVHKGILKRMVDQAGTQAGKYPSGLKEVLDSLYKSILDWRWLLQRAMAMGTMKCQKTTATWTRPNRRDPDLKGKKRLRMPEIVVAVDTSGSMGTDDVKRCFSEINKIANTARSLYLMQFSSRVECCDRVKRLKQENIELKDRGGTDFDAVYNYVENKIPAKHPLLIILTDGEDNEGSPRDGFELIWVILETRNTEKSWGKVIILPENKSKDG